MQQHPFSLKYGRGELKFTIPEEQLLLEILGRDYPAIKDVTATLKYAMDHPIDSPPLREIVKPGEKVAITVSDITRLWQQMPMVMPHIVNTLNEAGVPDQNITIINVVGGHRSNTEEEFKALCGEDVFKRVKIVNHDARKLENMVYLGKTSRGTEVSINKIVAEADRLIMTGGIVYHYMVGYGGGRKSVMPGFCSIKTIQQNHLWALGSELGSGSNPNSVSGKTRGNEVHEDMMEIAGFVQPDFIVNMVPTPEGDFAGIFAGNWVSAWMEGTKLVDDIYGIDIDGLADIVIATAGGYPKDINLYQTGKTMDNSIYAVKKGGVVIILSECPDINEPHEFTQWFQYATKLDMEKALRDNFTIPGWVAWREVECGDTATFVMVTRPENAELVLKANMIPATTMEEALQIAREKCGTDKPTFTIMPQAANTLPRLRTQDKL